MADDGLATHAYDRFRKKRSEIEIGSADINEATVRLRVINMILFDVLGWDPKLVDAETWCRTTGFADYVFVVDGKKSMVLEAKREGISFVLPAQTYDDEPVPFALLAKECKEAADALRQAQSYAVQFGARYLAITNGHQWLMALTFVTNEAIEERHVFVFESIEAIDRKFRTFYECFSSTAIASNLPNLRLLDARRAPAPPKLSSEIISYPITAERNTLINTLRHVLLLVWDEANFNPDSEIFLNACYVRPEPADDMLRVANELLEQRRATDASFSATVELVEAKIVSGQKKIVEGDDAANREKPIVLVGRIGNGKSTFLKYLRHISAKKLLQNDYIQIDLDFVDRPATAGDVSAFILDEVERQLKQIYKIDVDSDQFVRHALRRELREFQTTPRAVLLSGSGQELELKKAELAFIESFTSDRAKYYKYVMRHLRGSYRKSIAIFFDNLDRRVDEIQVQAFLHASTIAADWSALVFVCLRPSTMQRSQAKGVLDTIAPRMFYVSPPRTAPMLRLRFQYAAQFASNVLPEEAYLRAKFSADVEGSLPKAADLFEAWDQSILKKPYIAQQYESVANGNVRLIIKYVRDTLTSNHLDTHKITDRLYKTGEYDLDENDTLRALIYGPFIHFDPNASLFVNLFEIRRADPTEHFSRVLLLEHCHRHANSGDKYGFVKLDTIHSFMGSLGYSERQITEATDALFGKKCIEGRDLNEESPELGSEIRITSLGSYQIGTLARKFDYLDAVVVDTPILEEKTRQKIWDARSIKDRTKRAREFLRYLDRAAMSLTDADARRAWSDISLALANHITDVEGATRQN